MRAAYTLLILFQVLSLTLAVCVLESEFGFILNCNFKKSGLFRVRNLGGLKAHFGLGFSLGDELGFSESLGNLEGNRRRALNYKTGFSNKVGNVAPKMQPTKRSTEVNNNRSFGSNNQNTSSMTEVMFLPLGVPTFRPIPTMAVANNGMQLASRRVFVTDMMQDQGNETNVVSVQDMKNLFDAKDNAFGEFKNSTNDNEDSMYKSNQNNNMIQQSNLSNTSFRKKSENTDVMNAPKEYYPSGYDKNFDDNFKSKVKLPPNDFRCANQKHFPGLYANIELGCMVFHVCAITEDGIVMKSFLCPESTLFDQSILKCNWWFYVDCNNSTYDSNIPVSKSYQLMMSLSYLSNVTKN